LGQTGAGYDAAGSVEEPGWFRESSNAVATKTPRLCTGVRKLGGCGVGDYARELSGEKMTARVSRVLLQWNWASQMNIVKNVVVFSCLWRSG
jgi:hypothetical protein